MIVEKLGDYFETMSDEFENNPLLSIDYLRRSYLISGKEELRIKSQEIIKQANISGRAKNSVEMLLANF